MHYFLRSMSIVAVDAVALAELALATAKIAHAEAFTGHARTVELRLAEGEDRGP